jgi:uncharacterized protein
MAVAEAASPAAPAAQACAANGEPPAGTEEQAAAPAVAEELPADAVQDASPAENTANLDPTAAPIPSQAHLPPRTRAGKSLRASKKEKKRQKLEAAFKDYFHFSESLSRIPPHRVLAINRGERARILRVKIELDLEAVLATAEKCLLAADHPFHSFLSACLRDALQRLILPSLERETRRELTEAAEQHAVDVFIRNLRKLLLQPPVHGHRVLAVDPGFRNGCKLIALDEFGNVLGHDILHVVGRDERRQEARGKVAQMVRQYGLSVVAIGNGTGCRETEQLVADVITHELADTDVAYVVVNEAGASVYSTSPVGREELPDYDPVLRSAISIGRRLLDPLSELVKINPANIGVGLYQHDVKAKHLRESLDAVVESCVNYVGVDANTASPALLRYVSGLNQLTARRVYEFRREHGPFRVREDLKKVPGFGEATFVQAAGFLKIRDGDEPLDATWIHPESYDIAGRVLEKLDADVDVLRTAVARATAPAPPSSPAATTTDDTTADMVVESGPVLSAETNAGEAVASIAAAPATVVAGDREAAEPAAATDGQADISSAARASQAETFEEALAVEARQQARARLADKVANVSVHDLAVELGAGEMLLRDILVALTRFGRDPREDLPPPVFRRGIMKLEDLKPGMELTGSVLNVVDFGAFVDIGLTESGLVHISRLADRYIRDPHEVVGVGDTLKVWVLDVDRERRRVSLTAVPPGTERKRPEPKPKSSLNLKPPAPASSAPVKSLPPPPRQRGRPPAKRARVGKGRSWTANTSLPAKPLTKAMEEGKEPLRSFGDLLQFYEKKHQSDSDTTDE